MPLQPNSGFQWKDISGTAAGTTTLSTRNTVLSKVLIPASATGTVTIYDSASGTTAKSFNLVNDSVDFPTSVNLDIQMKEGLTYATGGTVNMVLIYD